MRHEWASLQSSIQSTCSMMEASGWYSIVCPMCGGGKEKRTTGGFLLTDDTIVYSCFRGKCDAATGMEFGNFVPNKFKALMERMGIPIGMKLRTAQRIIKDKEIESLDTTLYTKHSYPSIAIPDYWVPVSDVDVPHLTDPLLDRCCVLDDIHYISSGQYHGLLGIVHKWYNRPVALTVLGDYPFQIDGADHMMYTVGGKLDDSLPVLLVEGEMDSLSFPNAISVKGYNISPEQAFLLRGKKVICIPEKSNRFIQQFEDYGYSMCIPPWDADDLNAAVVKYGVLVVAKMIMDNTIDNPFKARLSYALWEKNLRK